MPQRLNNRHHLVSLMAASGWRQVDIARELGYSPARVSQVLDTPLIRAQVEQFQKQFRDGMVDDVLAKLARDTDNNVEQLFWIRSHGTKEDAVRAKVGLTLLEYQVAKKAAKTEEEHVVRHVYDAQLMRQMMTAMALNEGMRPPPEAIAAVATPEPTAIRAKTPEEALEELRAEDGGDG